MLYGEELVVMVVVVVVLVWVLFSHARTLREGLTNHFPPEPFFFFKEEISSQTRIPLFRPGSVHSG